MRDSPEGEDGTVYGSFQTSPLTPSWEKYSGTITASKSTGKARLSIVTKAKKGKLLLDMVSFFPQKTFKGRKNGLRPDLAQALADLHPKFLRFPGGCVVYGYGLAQAYRWKDSVGDVAKRRANHTTWGYHESLGLGYYEYFQFCEDIGATPLPVLPVGVSCGFNFYDVQQMFSCNKGDVYLSNRVIPGRENEAPQIALSATRDNSSREVILKLVNYGSTEVDADIHLAGIGSSSLQLKAEVTVLTGNPNAVNTLRNPDGAVPQKREFNAGEEFEYKIPPYSVQVIRVASR